MSNVVNQADDSELTMATRLEIDRWANCYVAVMGAPPLEEEEPNEAQLSALNRRVNVLKQPPYADFGVWLPFARRTQKAQKFRAFLPVGDGSYVVREMPGPQNMIQWLGFLEGLQSGPHHAGHSVFGIASALREDDGTSGDAMAEMLAPDSHGR